MHLQVDAGEPAWLVISHNYHPHWTASMDGRDAPLRRANYVWQALRLEPGQREVELRYASPALTWSRWATAISLAVALGLVAMAWRKERAGRPVSRPM